MAATIVLAGGQLARAQNTGADQQQPSTSSSDQGAQPSASSASTASSSGLSEADKKFITKAAQGGMAEVKLGQLAQEKGASDSVKKFGQQMVDDHGKANDQLKQIAQSKGVQVPSALDPKDQALYDKLSSLNGAEFDRAYANAMRKDHRKDVAEFRKQSQKSQDSDVKNFASTTLPTLETHLRMAEALGMKEAGSSASTGTMDRDRGVNTDNSGAPSPMPADQNPGANPGGMSGQGTPRNPSSQGPGQANPR
jgi:putative membrane protein